MGDKNLQKHYIKNAFNQVDKDHNGSIDMRELKILLSALA